MPPELSQERALELYSDLIGLKETKFGADDTIETKRSLMESAVQEVFKGEEIPANIPLLIQKKFPSDEQKNGESNSSN